MDQQCFDTLEFSTKYDSRLSDTKKYKKSMDRLQTYVDGLMQYTVSALHDDIPVNNSGLAQQFGPPFNGLPDQILTLDMIKVMCYNVFVFL